MADNLSFIVAVLLRPSSTLSYCPRSRKPGSAGAWGGLAQPNPPMHHGY
jgi:hypothetical protein